MIITVDITYIFFILNSRRSKIERGAGGVVDCDRFAPSIAQRMENQRPTASFIHLLHWYIQKKQA